LAAATRFERVAVMVVAEAVLLPMPVAPAVVGLRCTSGLDLRIADSTHWFPDRKKLCPRTTGNSRRRSMSNSATNRRFGNVNSGDNGTRIVCSENRAKQNFGWLKRTRWLVPEQNGRLASALLQVSSIRRHR